MSTETPRDADRALEQILEQAEPRPVPSAEATSRARLAAEEQWKSTIGRRRGRRRMQIFATAAGAVLAVAIAITTIFAPQPPAVQVATVDRAVGAIYILGNEARLERTEELTSVMSGQTIVTGDAAAVGLRWGRGGSLRLDQNTEIAFLSADRVELASGTVYFDSLSVLADDAALTIVTPHGDVVHIGTQFQVSTSDDELIVQVREGRVEITGRFHDATARRGEMVNIRGSERPLRTNIPTYGRSWEWVEQVATPANPMQGRTLREFLGWVQRETGLEVVFEDAAVEASVMRDTMAGEVSESPRVALRQRLRTYDLSFEELDGQIHIRPLNP